MSIRDALTVTNILFVAGGIYFVALAALGQAPSYTAIVGVFSFVAFALSLWQGLYFTGPWRVASAVAVLVLLAGQLYASFSIVSISDVYTVGVILLNGVWFILFLGVLLSSARDVTKTKTREEEEEEATEKETVA